MPIQARAVDLLQVRRSVDALSRETSPLLDAYRRAVEVMMQRDVADRTSWWFQANIYGVAETEITGSLTQFEKYWRQTEHTRKTYLFLSWCRVYLYFFERIARRACGDPLFALPYWGYDDPAQAALPAAFRPSEEEIAKPPAERKNPLARAKRLPQVEHGALALTGIANDIKAALSLPRFASETPLEARETFGGIRVTHPLVGAGRAEDISNQVHSIIGLGGDMGSPATAGRDPIFYLHLANIDRLWVKWSDPERGRIPSVDDEGWMKKTFTFVDENGDDRTMSGADILDTQHQLAYRYDDDPPRPKRLIVTAPPGGTVGERPEPVVLARGEGGELQARESHFVMKPVPRPRVVPKKAASKGTLQPPRTLLVLKDVAARDRTPPYELSLVLEGTNVFEGKQTSERARTLYLFGDTGNGRTDSDRDPEIIAFDVSEAFARLSKIRGYSIQYLRVAVTRRAMQETSGKEFVPADPMPPLIGSIELVQL